MKERGARYDLELPFGIMYDNYLFHFTFDATSSLFTLTLIIYHYSSVREVLPVVDPL